MSERNRLWIELFTVVVFCAFFFFYGLGSFGLVGADEPRFAQVAREMFNRHEMITPYLNGSPWLEKPALYYWRAMIAYKLFGPQDWAARLPSATYGLLLVVIIFFHMRRFRPGAQVDAALITASCAAIIGFARGASTDMQLAAPFGIAMLGWYAWYETRKKIWLLDLYVFLAIGTLAKGPVAAGLGGLIVILFCLLRRDFKSALRTLWLPGILLYAAIVLPWYISVQLENPTFFRVFFVEHNLERFSTNLYHHQQPFWYYLPVMALALLPWTVYAVAAIIDAVRGEIRFWQESRNFSAPADAPLAGAASIAAASTAAASTAAASIAAASTAGASTAGASTAAASTAAASIAAASTAGDSPESLVAAVSSSSLAGEEDARAGALLPAAAAPGLPPDAAPSLHYRPDGFPQFLLLWAITPLVFFSLSHSKLPGYILPAVPPCTILIADYFRRRRGQHLSGLMALLHAAVVAAVAAALLLLPWLLLHPKTMPPPAARIWAGGAALFLFLMVAVTIHQSGLRMVRLVTVAPLILLMGFLLRTGGPIIDQVYSSRPVARDLAQIETRKSEIAVFKVKREVEYGLGFYRDQAVKSYDRHEIPAGDHLLVAREGTRAELNQLLAGRRLSPLGGFPAQHLEYFWVSQPR